MNRNIVGLAHRTGSQTQADQDPGGQDGFHGIPERSGGLLQRQPAVDGMMALGPDGAEPALQAIDKMARTGKIRFGTFDLSPAILQALVQKHLDFAIDQQQRLQGYLPVIFLANYARYGAIPQSDSILTGPAFVTPENAQQVIDLSKKGIR